MYSFNLKFVISLIVIFSLLFISDHIDTAAAQAAPSCPPTYDTASCDNVGAGAPCCGKVDGAPAACVKPADGTPPQPGLLGVISEIVNADTSQGGFVCTQSGAAPAGSPANFLPCCDSSTGTSSECVSVDVGQVVEAYVCVGGAVGSLLNQLVGNLPISIAAVP